MTSYTEERIPSLIPQCHQAQFIIVFHRLDPNFAPTPCQTSVHIF